MCHKVLRQDGVDNGKSKIEMKTMSVQKSRNWKRQTRAREHAETAIQLLRMGCQENHITALCKGDR